MPRSMDVPLVAHFEGRLVDPIFLFAAFFDSGPLRFWTGIGQLEALGETFFGFGNLIQVSKIEETSEPRAPAATLVLSGVPTEIIAYAMVEPYQGRPARCWIGALDGGVLIGTPYQLYEGVMDVMEVEKGGETAIVRMNVESRKVQGLRARERNYTHQDQQRRFAGDTFLESVTEQQDRVTTLREK